MKAPQRIIKTMLNESLLILLTAVLLVLFGAEFLAATMVENLF